jgi:hypothetical protein
MRTSARILLLLGAAGVIAAAFLPWVTVEGLPIKLDLLQTRISAVGRTVSGTETVAGPGVIGVGAAVAALAVLNRARRLLVVLGLLVTLAGAGLLYYVLNVVDIETAGQNVIQKEAVRAAASSSAGLGPFLLVASGVCILAGALVRR